MLAAVNDFRRNAVAQKTVRRTAMPLPYQPKTIVITASRKRPGAERAQMVVAGQAGGASAKPAAKAAAVTPPAQRATQAQIADTMRQIRLAEAQGQPTDGLRQQLSTLVDSLKTP